MSAHINSLAKMRGLQFSLLLFFAAILTFTPSLVSADTLPTGVLERQTCGSFSVDIRGYGAGMMHNTKGIEVTNRRVTHINAAENCAVVEWESSTPAATQVLFAELGDEPVAIDVSIDPNFGYPHASTQNNAGIAHHTAILTGLETGKAYSYRLVTRSHPSAIPTISDPQVLIAGPTVTTYAPVVIPPVTVKTPKPTTNPREDNTSNTTSVKTTPSSGTAEVEKEPEITVPAAITAAEEALGVKSQERHVWKSIKGFFVSLFPDQERLSLSSSIGLFEKDRYIIPTLLFLGILFLIQHLVLPAFSISLKNPLLYWLVGSIVLAVLSSMFMLYYITLIAIAIFLGILAWYLLQNISDEKDAPVQIKLLDAVSTSAKDRKNKKG